MLFVTACSTAGIDILDASDWSIERVSVALAKKLADKVVGITKDNIIALSIKEIYSQLKAQSQLLNVHFSCVYDKHFIIYDNGACFSLRRIDNSVPFTKSKMIIPYGVQVIASHTFEGCTELKEVELPYTLDIIYDCAFKGTGIESIDLKRVSTIHKMAFSETQIRDLTIPCTVQKLGSYAFAKSPQLETVCFKGAIERIERRVFSNAEKLKKVRFYGAIDCIDDGAFAGTAIERVTIPKGSKRIYAGAFGWTSALKFVSFYGDIEYIDNNAFDLNALRTIEVKDSRLITAKIDAYLSRADCYWAGITILRK